MFGRFGHHLRSLPKPWSPPDRAAIAVAIDAAAGVCSTGPVAAAAPALAEIAELRAWRRGPSSG